MTDPLLDGDVLLCPLCRSEWLHHGPVAVFEREGGKEDAPRTLKTRIAGRLTNCSIIKSEISGNPSCRRNGITVTFWCEGCRGYSDLTLAQHKGQTFIEWQPPTDEWLSYDDE